MKKLRTKYSLKQRKMWKLIVATRGGTPYNGLYGDAPPERGTFLRLEVYERVGISRVEVYERVGISRRIGKGSEATPMKHKKGRENCHLSIIKMAFQNISNRRT